MIIVSDTSPLIDAIIQQANFRVSDRLYLEVLIAARENYQQRSLKSKKRADRDLDTDTGIITEIVDN